MSTVLARPSSELGRLAAACGALPLFPLPGVVLLPGPALPLHVFEPRYRQLVQDVLDGGYLAIPQLAEPSPIDGPSGPAILPYASAGKILAHRLLDDGRYNILVLPLGRVRLDEELTGRSEPYRMGRMTLLIDTPFVPRDVDKVGARLLALVGPVLARMGARAGELRKGLSQLGPSQIAESIAPFVLREAQERQAYLAENDRVTRAILVERAVLGVMADMGETAGEA